MIAEFIKTSSGMQLGAGAYGVTKNIQMAPYTATVVAKNAEVCKIDGRQSTGTYDLSVAFADESVMIKIPMADTNIGYALRLVSAVAKGLTNGAPVQAADELTCGKYFDAAGNQIGGETYTDGHEVVFDFKGNQLTVYEVNLPDGTRESAHKPWRTMAICAYDKAGKLVGEIIKSPWPSNNKRTKYTIYAEDDKYFKELVLITVVTAYNYDPLDDDARADMKTNPAQRGRYLYLHAGGNDASRYSETFVQQIRGKEGAENLPENMPMVAEKMKAAKNAPEMKIARIGILALLVIMIVIIVIAMMNK